MNLVLDASVAAKWFLPSADEPLVEEALALLRRYTDGEIQLIVPDLFWAELANIFWKAVRIGRISQKSATDALSALLDLGLSTVSGRELAEDALGIAISTGRTAYDAMYVALAMKRSSTFVTADERLVNALATHWPVTWLALL